MARRSKPKPAANGGQPEPPRYTKLTPEVTDTILLYVKGGNFLETASAAAGIDPRTLRDWMRYGARGREPYAAFFKKVHEAMAKAQAVDVIRIGQAGKDDWKALAWRLERMDPKRWGFRVRVEVQEELEAFLDKLKDALAPEVYEQILAIAAGDYRGEPVSGDTPGQEPVH